jgi:hypothetical protein
MANEIGNVKGITGTSMALNNQAGQGTQKPMPSGGKSDPGGTKPNEIKDAHVPMPK